MASASVSRVEGPAGSRAGRHFDYRDSPEFFLVPRSHKDAWCLASDAFPPPLAFIELSQVLLCLLPTAGDIARGMPAGFAAVWIFT